MMPRSVPSWTRRRSLPPPRTRRETPDLGRELDELAGPTPMPRDLQEALDDAEALLLATGHATFDLPEGFRMFQLPTERIM